MEELLSPEEVGESLGVSVYTVRRWIKEGKIRAFRPGKEYRVRATDLEEFFAAREVHPKVEERPSEPGQDQLDLSEYEQGWSLEVSYWIECLNAQAEHCERIIGLGGYDLETIWGLEGAAVEFWGAYSHTVRKLLRESGSPGQQEKLQRAEERMKAARTAARQAYRERREAEQDRRKVDELDQRRRQREARHTQGKHAETGS